MASDGYLDTLGRFRKVRDENIIRWNKSCVNQNFFIVSAAEKIVFFLIETGRVQRDKIVKRLWRHIVGQDVKGGGK